MTRTTYYLFHEGRKFLPLEITLLPVRLWLPLVRLNDPHHCRQTDRRGIKGSTRVTEWWGWRLPPMHYSPFTIASSPPLALITMISLLHMTDLRRGVGGEAATCGTTFFTRISKTDQLTFISSLGTYVSFLLREEECVRRYTDRVPRGLICRRYICVAISWLTCPWISVYITLARGDSFR